MYERYTLSRGVFSALMDLAIYGHIFRSALHFNILHELLVRQVEEALNTQQIRRSEERVTHLKTAHTVEVKASFTCGHSRSTTVSSE